MLQGPVYSGGDELSIDSSLEHNFKWLRASSKIVFAAPDDDNLGANIDADFFAEKVLGVRDLNVPPGYDLLINPYFFSNGMSLGRNQYGTDKLLEAVDANCGAVHKDDITTTILANTPARWFLICFRGDWGRLVK